MAPPNGTEEKLNVQEETRSQNVANEFRSPTTQALPDTQTKEQFRWTEQCLAASQLPGIVNNLPKKYQKQYRYLTTFSTNKDTSTTADFLNALHMKEGDSGFVNLTTYERAHMLWSFQLYKVLYNAEPEEPKLGQAVTYTHKADIPLIFEEMAAKDMSDYQAKKPSTYHLATGGTTQTYAGRPQTGYGLKSFEWSYVGANPATIRNDIEATMVLEFQNFNQLSKVRFHSSVVPGEEETPDPVPYSLLDLLGYGPLSPKNNEGSEDLYDPALYEIKAVIGWNAFDTTLQEKLKGQKTALFLTLIEHDFSISQIGTFTLTLTYRARLEAAAAQMQSNVLYSIDASGYSNKSATEQKDWGLVQYDEAIVEANCSSPERAEQLRKLRDIKDKEVLYESFSSFFSDELRYGHLSKLEDTFPTRKAQNDADIVKDRGNSNKLSGAKYPDDPSQIKIWKATYIREEIEEWLKDPTKFAVTYPDTIETISPTSKTDAETAIDAIISDIDSATAIGERNYSFGADGGTHNMHFILLGDLLEIMAHRAFSKQNFLQTEISAGSFGGANKMKIIMGPVDVAVQAGNGTTAVRCSLADLPITVEAFADFWYRNVIQQNRKVYNLLDFLRELGEQLINKAFGEGCAKSLTGAGLHGINGQTEMRTGFLALPEHPEDQLDPLLFLDPAVYDPTTGDILVEKLSGEEDEKGIQIIDPEALALTSADKLYNYIVLYVNNIKRMDKFTGDEDKDAARGIYHLKIHQGILQSINFQKTDQPYLRESRMQLNENPLVHLSNVYNIRASTVGNTLFYPGQMVYINPIGFGTALGKPTTKSSVSNVMGLGGYHVIKSVTNRISKDFTTEIVAQWDNNGAGRRDPWKPAGVNCPD
jgi:hypothetical protein